MTKQKRKLRPVFWIILVVLLIAVIFIMMNIPKKQQVSDSGFDLSQLSDGLYEGECSNGLVYVKLEVTLKDHIITKIDVLEHRNGMGQSAEGIVDTVIAEQSIEVDDVSQATFSSQTILKAVENALKK